MPTSSGTLYGTYDIESDPAVSKKYSVVVFDSLDAKSVSLGPLSQDYLVKVEIELVIWLEKSTLLFAKSALSNAGFKVVNLGNSAGRF